MYDEFVRLATERAKKRKVETKSLVLPILDLSKIKPLRLIIIFKHDRPDQDGQDHHHQGWRPVQQGERTRSPGGRRATGEGFVFSVSAPQVLL